MKMQRRVGNECADYFCFAAGADVDWHADFNSTWFNRAYFHVHADGCAGAGCGAEAVYRHRKIRDHGYPVFYFGG